MKLTNYGTVNTVPAYKNLEFSRSGSTGCVTLVNISSAIKQKGKTSRDPFTGRACNAYKWRGYGCLEVKH